MKLEKDKSRNVVSMIVWFIDYLKIKYGYGWALRDFHIYIFNYLFICNICIIYIHTYKLYIICIYNTYNIYNIYKI